MIVVIRDQEGQVAQLIADEIGQDIATKIMITTAMEMVQNNITRIDAKKRKNDMAAAFIKDLRAKATTDAAE